MTVETIVLQFIIFGGGFSLVLAVAQLFIREKHFRNWLFFGLYLCLSVFQFANANVDENLAYRYPHISLIDLPFLYALGPIMWVLFQIATRPLEEVRKYFFWQLLLPVGALGICLPYYFKASAAEKSYRLVEAFNSGQYTIFEFLYGFGVLVAALYLIWIFFALRNVWTVSLIKSELSVLQAFTILLLGLLVTVIVLTGILSLEAAFVRIGVATISLITVSIFIVGHRYPQFLQSFTLIVHQTRYGKAPLKEEEAERIRQQLTHVIEGNRVFLEEHLTLFDLANRIEATPHQLSQYLNVELRQNFNSFINSHRIAEAKRRLLAEDSNILSIAYAVGFNSKSSFNRAFQKHVGMTARQFRQSAGSKK